MIKKMKTLLLSFILLIGILFLPITSSFASHISLETTISSEIIDNQLKVKVISINKGDESAHNVRAQIQVGSKKILADKKTELTVGEIYQVIKTFPLSLKKPGSYPLILTMHYTDANQYPFSVLKCQTFGYKKEAVSPIFSSLNSITLSKNGNLNLTIKNLEQKDVKTKSRIIIPRELTVDKETCELDIPKKSQQKIIFPIKNLSALNGSTYHIFAISELEDKELHYTNISSGTVKIIISKNIFGLNYTTIIILLAVLIIFFVAAQFFKKK